MMTRRDFVRLAAAAAGGVVLPAPLGAYQSPTVAPRDDTDPRRVSGHLLAQVFPDIRRHFIFEYYPWYGVSPYVHWDQWNRIPPIDIASNYVPQLGAYDSRATAVLEQHARWIIESGAGAINVSWWGKDSYEDRNVPYVLDVMSAHDIKVTFHLEPYDATRVGKFADDIGYLIREYGDRRHWDCLLQIRHADGATGPVFKSFATNLTATETDCHGVTSANPDYASTAAWRQQTDRVRDTYRRDFDRLMLLSDSTDMGAIVASGFDGTAIYSNLVHPDRWRFHATNATARDLVFSFNINPGFDDIAMRNVDPGSCYAPLAFDPPSGPYNFSVAGDRERAEAASASRIGDSFDTTIALQRDSTLSDAGRGFFLVYICTFNEWHEGTMFEPMKDAGDLSAAERALGYHNPADGSYRLKALTSLLTNVI
ncbi:MAG TPA: twin-arginine translocation signal domain-containing protein [Vicinamibacterales bacterium]|nr:twin-arginine translocation signal domain-containing protein [Vicinamibacterales bacterium]